MPLVFSPEQVAFREAVRSFLAARSPEDEVRRLMATDAGYDPAAWAQLNEQLGAAGLAVPEEYGGSGYTFRELAIVLEEAGRSLLCAPLLSGLQALPGPQAQALQAAFGLVDGGVPDPFLVALATLSLLSEAAGEQPLARRLLARLAPGDLC